MTRARKGAAKGVSAKGPPAGSTGNLHKRLESERISSQIAAFEKSGGQVERLGTTRVLLKIGPDADAPSATPAIPAAKPRGRPRSG